MSSGVPASALRFCLTFSMLSSVNHRIRSSARMVRRAQLMRPRSSESGKSSGSKENASWEVVGAFRFMELHALNKDT